jgi:hypothetical protein
MMSIIRESRAYLLAYERKMEILEMEREEAAEAELVAAKQRVLGQLVASEAAAKANAKRVAAETREFITFPQAKRMFKQRVLGQLVASEAAALARELFAEAPPATDDEVPEWLLTYPWAAELAAAKAYAKRVAAEPQEFISLAQAKREFDEDQAWHAECDEAWVGYESPYGTYQPTEWDVDLPYVPEVAVA